MNTRYFRITPFTVLFLLMASCSVPGGNPILNTSYHKRLGGVGADTGNGIFVRADGTTVAAGSISGDADFNGDGVIGSAPETTGAIFGSTDILATQFDSSGSLLWAKRLGGNAADSAYAAVADGNGNVTIVGSVTGDADLDGSGSIGTGLPEKASITYGGLDIVIVQFDSSGNWRWSQRLGGSGDDEAESVSVDSSGNVVVTGYVTGDADLNADEAIDLTSPEKAVFGATWDIFVVKFSVAGSWLDSLRLGGSGFDIGYGVRCDSSSNIVVAGTVQGNADLNGDGVIGAAPETAMFGATFDAVIVKCTPTFGSSWQKRVGGASSDVGFTIACDAAGSVIAAGYVIGDADLNGDGSVSATVPETAGAAYSLDDVFLSKFDLNGNQVWQKRLGGALIDRGLAVACDSSSSIIVSGFVNGAADFDGNGSIDPALPETPTGVYGLSDAFSAKFDLNGIFITAKRIGGTNDDQVNGVSADPAGNAVLCGKTQGDADLNADGAVSAGLPETVSSPYGSSDIFITTLSLP